MGATASIPRYPPLQSPSVAVFGPLDVIQLRREMEQNYMSLRRLASKKSPVPIAKKSVSTTAQPKPRSQTKTLVKQQKPPVQKVLGKKPSAPKTKSVVVAPSPVTETPSPTATPMTSSGKETKL